MAEDTKAPPGGSKPAVVPGAGPVKQSGPAPEQKTSADASGHAAKTAVAGAAPQKANEGKAATGRTGDAARIAIGAADAQPGMSMSGISMDAIRNIPVTLSVVLGTVNVPVASLMKMQRGEIISLSKKVAEPVEILANGKLIARGEIVVVEDGEPTFAVTLTELVGAKPPNPAESDN